MARYRARGLRCVQTALRLAPQLALAWDLMALLLPADRIAEKQHCWIKAATVDSKVSVIKIIRCHEPSLFVFILFL